MAWTQEQLDAMDLAITGGKLRVKLGEKEVFYRTMDELLKARAIIAAGVKSGTPAGRQPRFQVADFSC